jgi:uncharacterized membrane protein YfcA
MPPTTVFLVAGIAVAAGALVQGGVGLGLGLIAAPVVTLLDPALMPGSMLVAGAALPVLILAREARHTDWPGVSWALAGRIAGTAAGIWLVAAVPVPALGVLVGAAVLAVIAVTALGPSCPATAGRCSPRGWCPGRRAPPRPSAGRLSPCSTSAKPARGCGPRSRSS